MMFPDSGVCKTDGSVFQAGGLLELVPGESVDKVGL